MPQYVKQPFYCIQAIMKQLATQVMVKEESWLKAFHLLLTTGDGGLPRFDLAVLKRLCATEFMCIILWGLAFGNEGCF